MAETSYIPNPMPTPTASTWHPTSITPEGTREHVRIAKTIGGRFIECVVSVNNTGFDHYLMLWDRADEPPAGYQPRIPSKTLFDGQEGYLNFLPDGIEMFTGIVVTVSSDPYSYSPATDSFTIIVKYR